MKKNESIYIEMCRLYNPKRVPKIQQMVDTLYCEVSTILGINGNSVYSDSGQEIIQKYYRNNFKKRYARFRKTIKVRSA